MAGSTRAKGEHRAGCVVDAAQPGRPEADAEVGEASEAIARLVRSRPGGLR